MVRTRHRNQSQGLAVIISWGFQMSLFLFKAVGVWLLVITNTLIKII